MGVFEIMAKVFFSGGHKLLLISFLPREIVDLFIEFDFYFSWFDVDFQNWPKSRANGTQFKLIIWNIWINWKHNGTAAEFAIS
jgi:hypothetical protein